MIHINCFNWSDKLRKQSKTGAVQNIRPFHLKSLRFRPVRPGEKNLILQKCLIVDLRVKIFMFYNRLIWWRCPLLTLYTYQCIFRQIDPYFTDGSSSFINWTKLGFNYFLIVHSNHKISIEGQGCFYIKSLHGWCFFSNRVNSWLKDRKKEQK